MSTTDGTDATKQFTIVRTFAAPRETVWRAWTDPAIAAQWWHPHQVVVREGSTTIDLRVGGRFGYVMVAPNGIEFPAGGTYLEIREPERLRFTWAVTPDESDEPQDAPIATVDLVDLVDGRTEQTFHLLGGGDEHDGDRGAYSGWTEAFEELDWVFERGNR